MRTKNEHNGEHRSHPSTKMMTKEDLKRVWWWNPSQEQRKTIKRVHTKRSRRWLRGELKQMTNGSKRIDEWT
jgi:hypothetical protein